MAGKATLKSPTAESPTTRSMAAKPRVAKAAIAKPKIAKPKTAHPKNIDEYLAPFNANTRGALEKLRKTIHTVVPEAEECISYRLAAFRLNGKPLVAFGATANHCAFYLMSASTVETHRKELVNYDTSKGTIRFAADEPLPATLVRKLVRTRMAENAELSEAKALIPRAKNSAAARKSKRAPVAANGKPNHEAHSKKSKSENADPDNIDSVLASLKSLSSVRVRDGMARYAIPSDNAWGVAVGDIRRLAKRLGPSHTLASALWNAGWYEARMLAAFVDEPARVSLTQMERWSRDFDNWAICDTVCFTLFDRTPHAWDKVEAWSRRPEEFVKRAAFALLASLTVHDKHAEDQRFSHGLLLIEPAATDERNFVKKSVNWALRSIGKRSLALNGLAVEVSQRLASSANAAARWVGKDALRELTSPAVKKRLAARRTTAK